MKITQYQNIVINGYKFSVGVAYGLSCAIGINMKPTELYPMIILHPELAEDLAQALIDSTEHYRSPLYQWALRKTGRAR